MAKGKVKVKKEEKLEDILFSCRDNLRGRASMTDKRDLLLTLVFLKFVFDRFDEQTERLREEFKAAPELLEIQLKRPASYGKKGVIFLPDECRWDKLVNVEPVKMAVAFDDAIRILEQQEEKLRNALPQGIFTQCDLEPQVLKSVVDNINKIDRHRFADKDLIGHVYEYYLQAFSINQDKEEGEFYTPHSIVELIASLIEPFDGTLYDPCCGSGGMFIQCAKLIESKGGNTQTVNVYGQESEPATFRLAKMNLAVRGISYHLGTKAASSFTNDQHPDLKVDYIMANPPFNLKKWRTAQELLDDPRWKGYQVPPESNANYAWILHMLSKLNPADGVAGFLLANGALDDSDTLAIRRQLIENDKVEAIIILPRDMFYTTDISVTLWILNQNKHACIKNGHSWRDRIGEILFMDLRTWNQNTYEKGKFVQFSPEQIAQIQKIFFDWRTTGGTPYAQPELYYGANYEEIKAKGFSLVPSRYIEFVDRDMRQDFVSILSQTETSAIKCFTSLKDIISKTADAFNSLGMIQNEICHCRKIRLGNLIEQRDERNKDNKYGEDSARGVNTSKEIQKCKRMGEKLNTYKIAYTNDFVFNANIKLTKETEKFAIALYSGESPIIVTNFYTVFYITDSTQILPEFLLMYLSKNEFARYVKFVSCSSVRDRFDFSDMQDVEIPLPTIDIQRAIVSVLNLIRSVKLITGEADKQVHNFCSAFVQKIIHESIGG